MLEQDKARPGVELKITAESKVAKFVGCLMDTLWFVGRRHRELRVPDCFSQLDKIMKTTHRSTERGTISVHDIRMLANALEESTKFRSSHPKTGLTSRIMCACLFMGFVPISQEAKSNAPGQRTTKSPPPQRKQHKTKHTSSFVWLPIAVVFLALARTPSCEGRWKRQTITVLFKFTMGF